MSSRDIGMIPKGDLAHVLALLEQDILPHVVTLKMLNNYSHSMSIRLAEAESGWALSAFLPIAVSEWDRRTYPTAKGVVLLEGSNTSVKLSFLKELPNEVLVLKTGDDHLKKWLVQNPIAIKTTEYRSFTTDAAVSNFHQDPGIMQSGRLDDEASTLIQRNGYEPQELIRYFSAGAEWFGIRRDGHLVSVCFVFQNYGRVWEIAGVHTEPECRGRGLAKRVVAQAIEHLRSRNLMPRYQVRWDNAASIGLAESCGLSEFLRVDHYLISERPKAVSPTVPTGVT